MLEHRTRSKADVMIRAAALVAFLGASGCVTRPSSTDGAPAAEGLAGPVTHLLVSGRPQGAAAGIIGPASADARQGYVQIGHEPPGSSAVAGDVSELRDDGRTVTLDFNNSETAVVARVFFEDIVREPVVVDAALQGRVTLRTPTPISKPRALVMVREALAVHGAQIMRSGGIWRVQARATSGRGSGRDGAQIIPLRHLTPEAARSALTGLAGPGVEIQPLPGQNALSVGGPPADVQAIADAVRSIDIDQMRGMSFGLLPLRVANAAVVASELDRVVGRQAGGGQQFQVIPVSRMNALLVIARRPALLNEARRWAARLDQGGAEGRRIFVYPLQNRRAADVAKVLSEILPRTRDDQSLSRSGGMAGNPPLASPTSMAADPARQLTAGAGRSASGPSAEFTLPANAEASFDPSRHTGREASDAIRVSADTATNSIVVIARSEDRPTVEAAIRRLDVLPAQVLIEATIAEVRLGDNLRHGVRWYFESRGHSVSLTDSNTGSLAPVNPGLNYVFNALGARVVLRALEEVTNVNVISSPALTVLDNQTARLQVGDQVPIATRSSRSVTNPDAPIVNDIEMKDTGVILAVTPRVNASGLVMLDIVQEVSDVVPTTTSGINSPTIRQRRIVSSVAVASGNEVVLGGMIGSSQQVTNEGVPVLQHIPVLGNAFRSNAVRAGAKTELLIILRPTVIGNQNDLRMVTDQIRSRMRAGR